MRTIHRISLLTAIASMLLISVLHAQDGATLAATPPMGWNSWDSYGLSVTQTEFEQNAEWMAQNLRPHGWEYAVVDEGWYLLNPAGKAEGFRYTMDGQGRYLPAVNRFPSTAREAGFQKLADWVHARHMKFGIHIIRGIPREAVNRNLPIAGSHYTAAEAANKTDTCRWNPDNYGVRANAAGQAYYDSIAALYAGWGVDFVKIDCISHPYLDDEVHMFSAALRKAGRPIVLSLSPGPTPLDKAEDVAKYAQMWRISDDMWDHWQQSPKPGGTQGLLPQFALAAQWAKHVESGHWPDADMLPLGYLGPRPGDGQARESKLTAAEQKTLITLWSIFRSPLIMGGNLTKMGAATKALLTNDEVIAVDQHSKGGHEVTHDGRKAVWLAKSSEARSAYLALFNLADNEQTIVYPLQSIGMRGASFQVRDLWQRKDMGSTDKLKVTLPAHGAAIFRINSGE